MKMFLFQSSYFVNFGRSIFRRQFLRQATTGCSNMKTKEITNEMKQDIESYWRSRLPSNEFNVNDQSPKFYVLSMFPYPSGNLHMGHVRVYTISDTMARFYRMNGKNVIHPMGWDAFGLPAENAAIERNIPAAEWTRQNIATMKQRLQQLGCTFDWEREFATCDSKYYRWTQEMFLKLFDNGLAYQNEALVNWDPVDQTVLADEQVDKDGCSWRSGAKVEKKLLKQWFIRTTKFAKSLYDGLNDPMLEEWRDIVNLQQHWIGECTGYSFNLPIHYNSSCDTNDLRLKTLTIWTENPEHMKMASFVVIKSDHILSKLYTKEMIAEIRLGNPFVDGNVLPIIVSDEVVFPDFCNTYLGIPSINDSDRILAENNNISFTSILPDEPTIEDNRREVLDKATQLDIGGYLVSSKLRDWLISRQRYWGTPIPIIHCRTCGPVPVPSDQLPVQLPHPGEKHKSVLTACPKCGDKHGRRESDTMDTFVDSSWYFLRFLDPNNTKEMFSTKLASKLMPVDLYIGGKEHAVLHLYYARFVNHFLHSQGLVPHNEPFKRLLVQGMVMGRSYRIKGTGKYLPESAVEVLNEKKNKAVEKGTDTPVVMQWEKMSKSKLNGIDPGDIISEYGSDTLRLIILGDVAPTSHRNWSAATFPGLLNWQKRLWLTMYDFHRIRSEEIPEVVDPNCPKFIEKDFQFFDARNYYVKGATFHYRHTHQLSVAISKMQGLTNSIRRATPALIKYGQHYERALAAQIMMLAPMAPHFASELWAQFLSIPNRINNDRMKSETKWESDVLEQSWPNVDLDYELDLIIMINGSEQAVIKYPRADMDRLSHEKAMSDAFNLDEVQKSFVTRKVRNSYLVLYPGCDGILNIFSDRRKTIEA